MNINGFETKYFQSGNIALITSLCFKINMARKIMEQPKYELRKDKTNSIIVYKRYSSDDANCSECKEIIEIDLL